MTITVVANPLSIPPRNEITVSVPTGNVMSNPTVVRVVGGIETPIRQQPSAGFDTRVVYDYEAPYDTTVTYGFTTDYMNPAGTTVWDETWPDISNWTLQFGTTQFAVSGGKVVYTNTDGGNVYLSRAVPTGSYRVTIASLAMTSTTGANNSRLWLLSPGGGGIALWVVGGKVNYYDSVTNKSGKTSVNAATSFTVDLLGSSILISGSGGTPTSIGNRANTDISQVQLLGSVPGGSGTFTVGGVRVSAYPVPVTNSEVSSTVALSPLNSWLIHPSNPGLSVPISSTDQSAVTIRNIGDITNPSASTDHVIIGQSEPITTTSGPRYSDRLSIVLGTRTRVQELALNALLEDGTPLLFRFPASFDVGFDDGFYSVGDVTRSRLSQRPGDQMRNFTLPLTLVQSPIVSVQNAGWSYADVASAFLSYAVLRRAYDTYADLVIDNRNTGY